MFVRIAFKNAKRTKSIWSRGIAWFTMGKYSHVELWFDGPAAVALCFSSREGKGASFATVDLSKEYDFVELSSDMAMVQKVYGVAKTYEGQEYDWLGLANFLLKVGIHKGHEVFCSEVCFKILTEAGLLHSSEPGFHVSPQDLANFVEIKYGSLKPLYATS